MKAVRKYRQHLEATALVAAGCLTLTTAHAETIDSFALSPEQLFGATVMSVSKTPQKLMDAPAAIYVLTNEDIQRSGATSIAEALRLVPGVQVARTHAGGWAISVRGFNTGLANKLLVLMDGREVYDQLFSGVYWDVQDTVLEDIERIEVIRGPGAALWGANAVNGVINIITKHAADTKGGMISAIAGNQDRAITTARYGGSFGNDIHYRAYAKYINRDEERAISGAGAQDGQQAYRGGFRSDWQRGKDSFTLQGDAVRNDDGQYRVSSLAALTEEKIHATGWNMLGRWTRELPQGERLTVQSYVDYTFRDQLLLADRRTSFDLDTQYEFAQTGRHLPIMGGRYRLSLDEITGSAAAIATHASRNDQLFSGFVQDKITLAPDKWYLTLGSKFEHNDYSGFEVQPNARLQWHIDETQMTWASVARAVRTPSQIEHDLTIDFLLGIIGLLPNTNFESEELIAYELGYRRQITPMVMLDIAAFYNDYDKISATTLAAGGPFIINTTATNGTTAETYGGEIMLDWRANEKLRFSASYSLLDMQLHGPAGAIDPEVAEGQSPHHQFNFRTAWNVRDNVSLDTMLYYVDGLPDMQVEYYWRLDLGIGWKINDNLQFKLVGQNLLTSSHREFTALDDPFTPSARIGRNVYGKFTWTF